MKTFKKIIALLLVALMIMPLGTFANGEKIDTSNHWAKEEIQYLMGKGLVSGYSNGDFKPEQSITRAEFVKIINQVFGYSKVGQVNFKDVGKNDWFHDEIGKALEAGYIGGYGDNTIKPNSPISRQEASKIMGIVFDLDENKSKSANEFIDGSQIGDWAKGYVSILKDKGYIAGYLDKTFKPTNLIKRAEAVKMISNACGNIINLPGEYKEDADGNVLVNTTKVVLKDMSIKGDLYLAEGIKEGDATLDTVTVKGKTYIRGGGENSIIIRNSKLGEVVVKKENNNVRVVIDENTNISNLLINEYTVLVIKKGAKVESLSVTGKTKIEVEKGAQVGSIEIQAKGVEIKSEGTIGSVVSNQDVKINDKIFEKGKAIKLEDKTTKPTSSSGSSGGGGTTDPKTEVLISDITISSVGGATAIDIDGGTLQMSVDIQPVGATNKTVTWSVDNGTGSATINNTGLLKAVTNGMVTVKATAKDGSGIVGRKEIAISGQTDSVTLESIAIKTPATKLVYEVGESLDVTGLVIEGTYSDTSTKEEKITISNITGFDSLVAVASQTLTVTVDGKTTTYTVEIKEASVVPAVPVSAITVNPTTMDLTVGGASKTIVATVKPADATNKNVTWTSANTAVATVLNGVVTPVATGTTTITATTVDGGFTATTSVIVNAAPITDAEKVAIAKGNLNLGDVSAIIANMTLPTSQNEASVAWASNNTTVIANDGTVTRPEFASGDATVILTATLTVGSASDTKAFSVKVKAKAQYTLTLSGDNITSTPVAGLMDENTSVTITVAPAAGQQVKTFTVGGVDKKTELVANKYTFKINANTTVAVTYEALPITDAEKVAIAKGNLNLGAIDELKGNMTLPTVQNDATVTWSSSNPSVITTDGIVTRPEIGSGNATVTLTATITVGSSSDTKVFTATVLAKVVALKEITGFIALTAVDLNADENLVDLTALKASGKLPTKVIVTDGITPADATITDWIGTFDGTTTGAKTLIAVWTMPDGYIDEAEAINVEVTVKVNTAQTSGSLLPSTIVFANGTEVSKIFGDDPFTNAITGDGEGTITYTSGTPGTAIIDSTGKVTIVGVGTTVITATKAATATHATVTATYTLTVTAAPVLGTLNPTVTAGNGKVVLSAMTADAGYKFYYKHTAGTDVVNKPALDSTNLAGWTEFTTNTDITGANGTPIFVQVIKVATDGGKIKAWGEASATPAYVPVTGVTLSQTTMNLKVGTGAGTLTATIAPANATNKNVTWASSNEAVATVANGVVTPKAEGNAIITVTTADGSKTASCSVTVTAANVPSSISVNNKVLNSTNPYLVGGEPAASGTLGSGDCTAHFNHETGVLTLQGYNGGMIATIYGDTSPDLIIKLKGDNTVTTTDSQNGIYNGYSGNIYITSENEATLKVNSTSGNDYVYAIATHDVGGKSIIIGGEAKVVVTAETTAAGKGASVVQAGKDIIIQGNASLTGTSKSIATGGYAIYANGKIVINTTGNVDIDCSASSKSYALIGMAGVDIKNVKLMTLKISEGGNYMTGTVDLSKVAVHINETDNIATYRGGVPYNLTLSNGQITAVKDLNIGTEIQYKYQGLENDEITIKAKEISNFAFVKWTNQGGTDLDSSVVFLGGTDANSSQAKIKMPANDLSIKAQYKTTLFTTQPSFHRGAKQIKWNLSQTVDYGRLERKDGEAWAEQSSISIPIIKEGNIEVTSGPSGHPNTDVTDGTYRLAFYFNPANTEFLKHYSDEFEIKWDAQLDGTVTISGTPKYGETLTANVTGTQSDAGDLKYQWFADEAKISEETKATLALTTAHIGKTIKVQVSSDNYNMPIIKEVGVVARANGPGAIADYTGIFSGAGDTIYLTGLGVSTPNLEAAVAINGSTYGEYSDLHVYADGKAIISGLGIDSANNLTKVKVRIKETATHFVGADKEITLTASSLALSAATVPSDLQEGNENVSAGRSIITDATATGGYGSYTYSLEGADPEKFTINSSTGHVSVGSMALTKGTYNFTITVTDGLSSMAKQPITLTVAAADPIVASISNVVATNGTVTITLDKKPSVAPIAADFKATSNINVAGANALALTDFYYDGNVKVTYNFIPVVKTDVVQNVVVAVTYNSFEKVALPFEVEANVVGATETPVITGSIRAGDTSVSGTAVDGATVVLSVNDSAKTGVIATGGNWTVSGLTLVENDVIKVTAILAPNTISLEATTTVLAAPDFAGGTGTLGDPYKVATAKQLDKVRNYLDKHFIQTQNIDISSYNGGGGWNPIGVSFDNAFTGSYDGGGKTITGLTIDRALADNQGLFGYVNAASAKLENINLTEVSITGKEYVGGLVGRAYNVTISNCSVKGTVIGTNNVAGLAGGTTYATISKSYTSASVFGSNAGGLVGSNGNKSTITKSYSSALVSSPGGSSLGGLVGFNQGTINNSYATGDVTGSNYVGGLVGKNTSTEAITNCYASGLVTATTDLTKEIGGLVGYDKATDSYVPVEPTSSYYDKNTTKQSDEGKGVGKTTSEMKKAATFTGWDFTTIWTIVEGSSYPTLR